MMLFASLLSGFPAVVHGFTTARTAGAEDLGRGAPEARWRAAAAALDMEGAGVALVSQVHGADVLRVLEPGLAGEADALVTEVPGLLLAVRIADCVPILVVGARGVAAIHAGWRGLAAGVIGAAVEALGEARAAAVGPCISAASYEVGDEVIEGIAASGVPADVFVVPGPRRRHADLREAARWQLARAGVPLIEVLPDCTLLCPTLHSHRRDGASAGRQAAIIGLRW